VWLICSLPDLGTCDPAVPARSVVIFNHGAIATRPDGWS
jgi:hypothetical protein